VTGVAPASASAKGSNAYANLASNSQLQRGVMNVLERHADALERPQWALSNRSVDAFQLTWAESSLVVPLEWLAAGLNVTTGADWIGLGFYRLIGQQFGHEWSSMKHVRIGERSCPLAAWVSSSELLLVIPAGMGQARYAHVQTAGLLSSQG